MNKIIISSILVAIIVVGGIGMYFSVLMTTHQVNESHLAPVQNNQVKMQAPLSFPYQVSKNMFDQKTFVKTYSSSNDPIKFNSTQEISDFLKESQRIQQIVLYDQNSNRLMAPTPFGSGSPVLEPRSMPSMREGQMLEESLQLSQKRTEAAPTYGGAEWNSGEQVVIQSGESDMNADSKTGYSTTNTQVKNVDEPDYLKTDGKYVYIASQNTILIIDAYPPESANLVLRFGLDINQQNIENIFLDRDKLVIIYYGTAESQTISEYDYRPYPIYNSVTFISVIDVSDKQHPQTIATHQVDGNYNSARMIGNTVYVISTNGAEYANLMIPAITSNDLVIHPDVYRFPNMEDGYQFNTVTAIDTSGKLINSETFLMGYTNTIYVSEKNLYVTYQKNISPTDYESVQKERFFDVIIPLLPQDIQERIKSIQNDSVKDSRQKWKEVSKLLQDTYNNLSKEEKDDLFSKMSKAIADYDSKFQNDTRRTVIHKIALGDGKFDYIANNDVPGYPLNQFSMDESSGLFRIATTSETYQPNRVILSNNVYVLDDKLQTVGSLEKIAPGEKIYSARFMGDKLYLVTFRQIDPFFVIDLSGQPKIMGELKIPGFSSYLQAYDDTHIIGVGRDTKENSWGGVEQKGIKISMFDVSDFKNPKETDTILIGDSSTYSDAMDNHKALLLDKEKGIISIPVKTSLASIRPQSQIKDNDYNQNWYGFYVYSLDSSGFKEKGQITHYMWQYNYNLPAMSPRSFYIGDYLYTVMDGSMKINSIDDLIEKGSIKIQQEGKIIPFVK